jgi:DNA replication protein DnaC
MHTVIELARELRLSGLAEALEQQLPDQSYDDLTLAERLGGLFLAEKEKRHNAMLERLRKDAKLKLPASPEELNYSSERGFQKAQMRELLQCTWVRHGWNILVSGETGTGKTWLACCIATAAIRNAIKSKYYKVDDLLYEMALARADGNYLKFKVRLEKYDLLILDDFGVTPMNQQAKSDLLAIIEDRVNLRSTIFVGQRPYNDWHAFIDDPIIADAVLDRLSHNRYHVKLKGQSRRKKEASLADI